MFKKRLAQQPHADILPEYPVKIQPHMSDNKLRLAKKPIYKKLFFEKKKKLYICLKINNYLIK
jgi:hypothetical protein